MKMYKMRYLIFFCLLSFISVGQTPTNYIPHGGRHYYSDSVRFNKTITAPNTPVSPAGLALLQITTNGLFVRDTSCGKPWCTGGNTPTNSTSFLGTTNSKDLVFKTKNTEAMRIDTNGNVGIGTATPDGIFEIYNLTCGVEVGNINGRTLFKSDTMAAISDMSGSLYIYSDVINRQFCIGDCSSSLNETAITINDFDKSISVYDSIVYFNSTITSYTGNVGIGTATPTAKLHINGNVRIEGTDSVTIYAKTPANGTFEYCTNCSGNGITGRLLGYIGSAWRRFTMD